MWDKNDHKGRLETTHCLCSFQISSSKTCSSWPCVVSQAHNSMALAGPAQGGGLHHLLKELNHIYSA